MRTLQRSRRTAPQLALCPLLEQRRGHWILAFRLPCRSRPTFYIRTQFGNAFCDCVSSNFVSAGESLCQVRTEKLHKIPHSLQCIDSLSILVWLASMRCVVPPDVLHVLAMICGIREIHKE